VQGYSFDTSREQAQIPILVERLLESSMLILSMDLSLQMLLEYTIERDHGAILWMGGHRLDTSKDAIFHSDSEVNESSSTLHQLVRRSSPFYCVSISSLVESIYSFHRWKGYGSDAIQDPLLHTYPSTPHQFRR